MKMQLQTTSTAKATAEKDAMIIVRDELLFFPVVFLVLFDGGDVAGGGVDVNGVSGVVRL